MVGDRTAPTRVSPAGLTAREVEGLRILARGLSNREIVARLLISPMTASNHVEHIIAEISAPDRASPIPFALHHIR